MQFANLIKEVRPTIPKTPSRWLSNILRDLHNPKGSNPPVIICDVSIMRSHQICILNVSCVLHNMQFITFWTEIPSHTVHWSLILCIGQINYIMTSTVYHLNLVKFSKCAEMTSFFTFLYSPCLSHQAARCLFTIYLICYTISTSTLIIVKIADGLISSLTLIRARSMACPLAISNSILFIKRKGDKYMPIWLLLKTWHLANRSSRFRSLYILIWRGKKCVQKWKKHQRPE